MCDERVDQSSIRISGRRVHDEAGWFFDDDEVLVFINDLEGDFLSLRNRRCRGWNEDYVDFTGFDPEIAVSYRFARL